MRIGVASVYTPGMRGGAELHAEGLMRALNEAGHSVHSIQMPFHYWPMEGVAKSMADWSQVDFSRYGGGQIDKLICLKFPTYYLNHPDKAVWLLHQHRPAYDLYGTDLGFPANAAGARLRAKIIDRDTTALAELDVVHTNSRRVSERLLAANGVASTPLYHPPYGAEEFSCAEPLPFIFFPSRLEELKRQHLLIDAVAQCPEPVGAVLAGDGGGRQALEKQIDRLGLTDRVRLVGRISRAEMLNYYASCTAVFFGPVDEDYGYITLEAMLSEKAVITCTDSGGPLEFVVDGETGRVVEPEPAAVANAVSQLTSSKRRTQEMGRAGRELLRDLNISWANVINVLIN